MSVDEKMTALADAIREKANKSGKMTIDEMTVTVRGISVGEGDATVQTEKQVLISSPSGVIAPDSGFDSMSSVAYDLDPASKANLIAGNIKQGVKILGVTGNYAPPAPEETDNWCGEYDGSAYAADSIVSYQGNIYRATTDTDNIPGDDSGDWELLNTPEVDQWCGEYNGSAYYAKSIVSYKGNIFRAIKDTDNEPEVNNTDWVRLNEGTWCGEYNGSAYYKGSVVSYGDDIYICNKDTDNEPSKSSDWEILYEALTISPKTPTFNANGTYYAKHDGYDGYSAVTIAVPSEIPEGYVKPEGRLEITDPVTTRNCTNYAEVSVNVPIKDNKIITASGVYDASDEGYKGFAAVEVNIPTANILKGLEITPTKQKQVYSAEAAGADGYASLTVNPIPYNYIDKNTSLGHLIVDNDDNHITIDAEDRGYEGFSSVEVDINQWRGEYNGSAYQAGDMVSYQGNVYRATKSTDNEPTHSDWAMLNTPSEDISTEIATQKQLIANIKTALANKAAGGGTDNSALIDLIEGDATEFVIPDGTTKIGESAFANKTSLQSIIISNSVALIGTSAFSGCRQLKSITMPDSVTTMGGNVFQNCSSLEGITLSKSITTLGNSVFYNCTALQNITIPNGVTSIGANAFYGCSQLKSITMPDSVTSLNSYVFQNCSSLESIVLPPAITSIGTSMFAGCSKLKSVTIPSKVTRIDGNAFANCSALESIICLAETPPTVSSTSLPNTGAGHLTVYVLAASVDAYKAASYWGSRTKAIVAIS